MENLQGGVLTTFLRRRGPKRAFTLMEAIVVLIIVGILAGIASFAFQSVRRNSSDLSGTPVLGTVQSQARKVATTNSYQFPSDLKDQLAAMGMANLSFVSYPTPSPAPATEGGNNYTVSVSTSTANPTLAGYAVMTSPGHCTVLLDRTSTPSDSSAASIWVTTRNAAAGDCLAVLDCEQSWRSQISDNGTPQAPLDVPTTTCATPTPPAPAGPSCLQAKEQADGSVVLTWTKPRVTDNVGGYRLYRYAGSPDFNESNAQNTTVNKLASGFATGDGDQSTQATLGSGVTLGNPIDAAWEGTNGYFLNVPAATGNATALIKNASAAAVTAGQTYTFTVRGARDQQQDFPVAVKPRIEWYKANGTASSTPPADGRTVSLSRAWQQLKVTGVAPSDAVTARVSLILDKAAASLPADAYVRADGFVLEAGATPAPAPLPAPDRQWDVSGVTTTTAVDNVGLTPGAVYTWAVVSVAANSSTSTSSVADLRAAQETLPTIQVRTAAPTGLTAIQPTVTVNGQDQPGESLAVSWDRVNGASSYRVKKKTAGAPDSAYAVVSVVDKTSPEPARYSYTDTDVVYNNKYDYSIEPINPTIAYTVCGSFSSTGGSGTVGQTAPPVYPQSPKVYGDARGDGDTGRVNALWWDPVSAKPSDKYEVSMKPAEAPTSERVYSDNGWLACSGPANTEGAVDTTASTCLYGGDLRAGSSPLAVLHTSGTSTDYPVEAVRRDNQIAPGSKIYYRVRTAGTATTAADTGIRRSCWSNETQTYSGATRTCTAKAGAAGLGTEIRQPLGKPVITSTTIGAEDYGKKPVTVTWAPVTGATGYVVYRLNNNNALPPAADPANGPGLDGPQTVADPSWTASGMSIIGRYSSASATPALSGNSTNLNVTALGNGSYQFTTRETNPSRESYYVAAVRQQTGIFSEPTRTSVRVEPDVPTPVCQDATGGSKNIPITGVASPSLGMFAYNIYAYTSAAQAPEDGVKIANNIAGPTNTHTVATLGEAYAYRVTVNYVLDGNIVESDFGPLGGLNGTATTCKTGLSQPVVGSKFIDADGDGLVNDEVVWFDPVAGATHYVVVPDDSTAPTSVQVGQPVAASASYGQAAGNATVLTAAQAASTPNSSSPASIAEARGHITVAFTPSSVRTGAGPWTGQFSATNTSMADARVFSAPGVYKTSRTQVLAVTADASGNIVTASRTERPVTPSVTAPAAPETTQVKMRYGTVGGLYVQPYVSWPRNGILADWYAQPYAITGIQLHKDSPFGDDNMPYTTFPSDGLAAAADANIHDGTGTVHKVAGNRVEFGSKTNYTVRLLTKTSPTAAYNALPGSYSPATLGVAAPGTPQLTAVAEPGNSRVNVMWTVSGVQPDGYRIFRSAPTSQAGDGWTEIGTVPGWSRNYYDQLSTVATTYTYQVMAFNNRSGGQVYSKPAQSTFAAANHMSSGGTSQQASNGTWENLYINVAGSPTQYWQGSSISGLSGSWAGSYLIKGAAGYCIDLLDENPQSKPSAYPSDRLNPIDMNAAIRSGGGNLPANKRNIPITSAAENYQIAYVLGRFGSSYTNTVARAVDHYVRMHTVAGTGQSDWENKRWAKQPQATKDYYNNVLKSPSILGKRGPYDVAVNPSGAWNVDAPTPVTVTLNNGGADKNADSPLVLLYTDTAEPVPPLAMPGGGNSITVWMAPTTPDPGSVRAQVMTRPSNIAMWTPNDGKYQRMLVSGRAKPYESATAYRTAAGSVWN